MNPSRADLELPISALPAAGRLDGFRRLASFLCFALVVFVLTLVFVPWQQSVRGSGRVIAYAPVERQQAVEAPIDGRLETWYVEEGDRVNKGDPLAELSDNDPDILRRLARERDAAEAQVTAAKLAATLSETRIQSLILARDAAITNAQMQRQVAADRREVAHRAVDASAATLRAAELNLVRQRNLHGKGLASQRDLELAELDEATGRASQSRAEAALRAAEAEIKALDAEVSQVASSHDAGIEAARASLENSRADAAKAEAELAKVEVRLSRQQQMRVLAPRDGTILRIIARQGTEMVKAGDPLVLLVPESEASAVEIYVDGNDVPLIEPGRAVRLQFEGWPAVQFVGWPSVAVGTFGGVVRFVDSHDDGFGRFRVVVVPDDSNDWPSARHLRQGARANGWVLLNRVSLGFELWRKFNGFPPVVHPGPPAAMETKS